MLEKLPHAVGRALQGNRAGEEKLLHTVAAKDAPELLVVESAAVLEGGALPARFTQDGECVSPPLRWSGVTRDTPAVLVVVEDADSPTPQPIVHLLALVSPGADGDWAEGAIAARPGKNSFGKEGWLPPDPPPGHGPHRYVVQVFALKTAPDLHDGFGKADAKKALEAGVLAKGVLTATYERA